MIVNSHLFEAFLECSTKCWLRSRAEPTTGNAYAEWARAQNEAYYEGGLKSLREILPESDRAIAPPLTPVQAPSLALMLDYQPETVLRRKAALTGGKH